MTHRYSVDPTLTAVALETANKRLSVSDTLLTWCAVHGCVQLALRHPEFPNTTRELLKPFVEQLGTALVAEGFFTAETLKEAVETEERFRAKLFHNL